MLLDSSETVQATLETFDVTAESDIGDFFRRHNVDPLGVINYGSILTRAAIFMESTQDDPVTALLTLFAGGVALGLHLADMTASENAQTSAEPSETHGPMLDIGVTETDLQELAGEWTPQRLLYLARAAEMEAVCRVLNQVNREASFRA